MTEVNGTISEQPAELPYDYAAGNQDSGIWSWRGEPINLVLAVVIGLCAAGLLLLLAVPLLAVAQSVVGINLPGINNMVQWLAGGSKGLILAVVLAVTGTLSYLYLRHRLLHNAQLYSEAGCPQCKEQELIRVRRHRSDRVIARFGIPVRRYVCRNCSWGGLLIGGALPGSELGIVQGSAPDETQWPSIWEIDQNNQQQEGEGKKAAPDRAPKLT